jgi:hypothetical protein
LFHKVLRCHILTYCIIYLCYLMTLSVAQFTRVK